MANDSPDWTTLAAYLGQLIINTAITPGASLVDQLIAPYSNVVLFEFASPSGTADSVIAEHIQAFSPAQLFAADAFYATAEDTSNNGFLAVATPVLGNYLTVTNFHPTRTMQCVIFGMNTNPLGLRRFLGYAQPPHNVQGTNPAAIGGAIQSCPIIDYPAGQPVPKQIAFNGNVTVSGICSIAGTAYIYALGPDNVLRGYTLGAVAALVSFSFTTNFIGFGRIIFIPTANGNMSFTAAVTQGGPGP